jgi:predicted GH43/DUF377 family glycosyl hydrolase
MKLPVIGAHSRDGDVNYQAPRSFPLGPFTKYEKNPILTPNPDNEWECGYLYNASAIVVDNMVMLLYRAQNRAKISSIGLAWLEDGINFVRYLEPILKATEPWESNGGCEDPRIVRDPNSKIFIMTYTAYDLNAARLCIATSYDLFNWKKYPPFVPSNWHDIAYTWDQKPIIRGEWLKSGAIFVEPSTDGRYYMIWGYSELHLAVSDDLINWQVTGDYNGNVWGKQILNSETKLIESGPAPIKLDNGKNQWIFVYNCCTTGGKDIPQDSYTISQMLVDYDHIRDGPVARLERPTLKPDQDNELNGQVNKVVFCEGIVQFKNKWFLYFGQGDSNLGVAFADVN